MTQLVWCVKHGHYVELTTDVDGELCHYITNLIDGQPDYEECYFPEGFIPPYVFEMDDDWLNGLIEPSEEELALMDENAEALICELGLI